jgi:hypothetical protein
MIERRPLADRWVRLSATYFLDPKIMRAGPDAELLYVRGLAFARQVRSDGHITTEQLPMITNGLRHARQTCDALVTVGLWERCADGFRVPLDRWEHWQTTEHEIERGRTNARERQAKSRARRRDQDLEDGEQF